MQLVEQVRRYVSASNEHDLDRVEGMFAGNAEYVSKRSGSRAGREAIRAMMDDLFADFPDVRWTAGYYRSAEPGGIAYDFLMTATSPSTGETIERTGVERIFFDDGGKIRRVEVEA
jgi:uncharacterized protein (TIGR02246 family)